MIEFLMPSLGADMEDGTLVKWHKKPGDTVKRGDILADVETQKGLIEIEVFDEGVFEKQLIEEGTKVRVGTPMALIKQITSKSDTSVLPVSKAPEVHPIMEKPEIRLMDLPKGELRIKASPLARKMAAEKNIDISKIAGTGEGGVVTKDDVENAIAKITPLADKEKTTPEKVSVNDKNVTNTVRSAVAAAMSKSNREIPHYYLEKTMDMTKALLWMNESNKQRSVQQRLLPAALLIKAVALSLREVPELNAVWDNGLCLKDEIHIGFVVSLRSGGIIVPAIHSADIKSIDEIMTTLNDVIPRARALKLRSSELSDSTITITSIGEGGADVVYGVIYPPQVALIGFGSIAEKPFADNGMLGIHSLIQVTLAGDHRATDGLTGSRFLASLNKHLQNPGSL
jgi:pyruvate dehydrogenase E2 component (dihydrolipoamide acetyltransferase)